MQPDLVEIGQQSASRWQQIIETYAELGMVPSTADDRWPDFDADVRKLPAWIWYALAAGGLLILMVGRRRFFCPPQHAPEPRGGVAAANSRSPCGRARSVIGNWPISARRDLDAGLQEQALHLRQPFHREGARLYRRGGERPVDGRMR